MGGQWLWREKLLRLICLASRLCLTPHFWIHYPSECQQNCVAYKRTPKEHSTNFEFSWPLQLKTRSQNPFWLFPFHQLHSEHKGCHRHMRQPQSQETANQQDFVESSQCVNSKHATKCYLAGKHLQATRVERTEPIQSCAVCGSVAANHGLDNSQHGLLTEWQTVLSSQIQKREMNRPAL